MISLLRPLILLYMLGMVELLMANQAGLNQVSELQWRYRVLVVFKPHGEDLSHLLENQEQVDDRDIVWFVFKNNEVQSNYSGTINPGFIENTRHDYNEFTDQVLLIGKDGGIKDTASTLRLINLFEQIDAMPMRRQEMKRNKKPSLKK